MRKQFLYQNICILYLLLLCACTEENKVDTSSAFTLYGVDFRIGDQMIWHDDNNNVVEFKDYIFTDRYQSESGSWVENQIKGFTSEVKDHQTGNFILSFYGDGILLNTNLEQAVGEGACLCLHLASEDKDKLLPGKYIYGNNRDKNTFTGYSTSSFSNLEIEYPANPIVSGEVNVEINGDQYIVQFAGKNENGALLSCNYSGPIKTTDIRKENNMIVTYENVTLTALMDPFDQIDDNVWVSAFYATNSGNVYEAGDDFGYWEATDKRRNIVDIALAYDVANKTIYFESPIQTIALLMHNTYEDWGTLLDFSLYCHTVYCNAPADFTDNDFEALNSTDFTFPVTEEQIALACPSIGSHFVFFQNGKGIKGVIKVKSTEEGYPNPTLIADIKVLGDYSFLIR